MTPIEFIRTQAETLLEHRFNPKLDEYDKYHVTRESALVMLEYVLVQIEALKNYA